MHATTQRLFAALALSLCAHATFAADTAPATPDPLSTARSLIDASQWTGAIEELKRVNQPQSADWNNLMGYSHRKAKTPDLPAAERYYDAALRIDPTHRGALEYSGELYLMKGDLATAEQRLAALDKACRLPCGEYRDLKQSIERYKASHPK